MIQVGGKALKILCTSRVLCIIAVFVILIACKTEPTSGIALYREKLHDSNLIDSLDNLALNKGDTLAYKKLREIYYLGEGRLTGFLFYALVMANKHHYKEASQDVYGILKYRDQTLDSTTLKMADEYFVNK